MKKLFVIVSLFPYITCAQVSENFESGNLELWIQSPPGRWEISSEYPLNGSQSLHHAFDNASSGHDQISLPVSNLHIDEGTTTWSFIIRHGYPPSSLNNWGVFLLSNRDATQMFPGGNILAYVIGVNYIGSDDLVKIWKHEMDIITPVVESGLNWQTTISTEASAMFEITRTEEGLWTIRIDTTVTGQHYSDIGAGHDQQNLQSGFTGIYYEYSSAQDQKIWFDDLKISGHFVHDTVPPLVQVLRIRNNRDLYLEFNEPIRSLNASDSLNFSVEPGMGHPVDIKMVDQTSIQIEFRYSFRDETAYTLFLNGIEDLSQNRLTNITMPFYYYEVKPYDVVINEIMADPSPPVGLPEVEYVELYNTSEQSLRIQDWAVEIGNQKKELPDFDFPQGTYALIIPARDTIKFSGTSYVLGIESMPALTNTGQEITVYDGQDQVISNVEYNMDWYQDDLKSDGGWSLEQIDPLFPCQGESNWTASNDPTGGSPGRSNSVHHPNPDFTSPEINKAIIRNDNLLEVNFNEPYDRFRALDPLIYMVDPSMGQPDSVQLVAPQYKSILLHFRKTFSPGEIYTLTIDKKFTDCQGNSISAPATVLFGYPEKCDTLDVVINEVLFNPYYGGVDFVELINISDKIIDLATLVMADRDRENNRIEGVYPVSEDPVLFFPNDYLVITSDIGKVIPFYWHYDEKKFIEVPQMPGYPNDQGTVTIMDQWYEIIDEFKYTNDLHFTLLESTEGVSLEKIHPLLPSMDGTHWHSAAEDIGFATPGLINSQFSDSYSDPDPVWIEPEIFSPDNDGYDDIVKLHYKFSNPGYVASVYVFNSEGRMMIRLANNKLLGTSGCIIWDGEMENGDRAEIGIYVFLMELYNLKGELKIYKKTCVLASRLK